MSTDHVLDTAARSSLDGAHRRFSERLGRIARYQEDVAPFVAHPQDMTGADWTDLHMLAGSNASVPLIGLRHSDIPSDWSIETELGLVQMSGEALETRPEPDAVELGPADLPDIMALVAMTQPGPFRDRTIELGTYLGVRDSGRLVAMAGERMHPDGWTEISAVCTDPDYRGRGLAGRLVRAVGHGIVARGEKPFLHASATNVGAIRLYADLGFVMRLESGFMLVRTPADEPAVA